MRPTTRKNAGIATGKVSKRTLQRAGDGKPMTKRALLVRRFFHRAEARVETLPPFFATFSSIAFVGAFALYGFILSGKAHETLNDATASLGFEIKSVAISGHDNITERNVLDTLGIAPGVSLLTFNVASAHQALVNESWIKSASVRKLYPDKLAITIKERQPYAIWQRGTTNPIISIIAEDGSDLGAYQKAKHSNLPTIVGHGAQKNASAFLPLLNEFPGLKSRVKASLFRSQRRWDLLLSNDVTIKLPEGKERESLTNLVAIDNKNGILSKDIVSVDMRLADRLVMRLSDEAMLNRLATIKARKRAKSDEENT